MQSLAESTKTGGLPVDVGRAVAVLVSLSGPPRLAGLTGPGQLSKSVLPQDVGEVGLGKCLLNKWSRLIVCGLAQMRIKFYPSDVKF